VDALADEHLLVANCPEEYAAAALRLMNDAVERDRLAKAGRARMLSNHDWAASMQRLDAIVDRCLLAHPKG
jgi:hypothetical protein